MTNEQKIECYEEFMNPENGFTTVAHYAVFWNMDFREAKAMLKEGRQLYIERALLRVLLNWLAKTQN